jgi:hypothetical protein
MDSNSINTGWNAGSLGNSAWISRKSIGNESKVNLGQNFEQRQWEQGWLAGKFVRLLPDRVEIFKKLETKNAKRSLLAPGEMH